MDEKLREEIGLDKNAIKELKQIVEHDTCSTLTHGVEVSDDIVVDLMEFFREHGYIKVSDIGMSDEEINNALHEFYTSVKIGVYGGVISRDVDMLRYKALLQAYKEKLKREVG